MDTRHWPYDPYDPYARRRSRDDDGGWVIAGEEPDGWPPERYGPPQGSPRYGGPAGPPPEHRGGRPTPDPWPNQYPPPQPSHPGYGYPARDYDPRPTPGSYEWERRPARPPPSPGDEPDDEPPPAMAPVLTWTIGAYLLPMLVYLAWAFTRSGDAPAGCVDVSGGPCPSPRIEAAESLLGVLPALAGALALALLIALGLRRIAASWRAGSVGLAAAVIGGGFATLVAAAIG